MNYLTEILNAFVVLLIVVFAPVLAVAVVGLTVLFVAVVLVLGWAFFVLKASYEVLRAFAGRS